MSTKKIETHHRIVSRRKFLGFATAALGGGLVKIGLDSFQNETIQGSGGGAGPSRLRDLFDVKFGTLADKDLVFYDLASDRFKNEQPSTLGFLTTETDPLAVHKTGDTMTGDLNMDADIGIDISNIAAGKRLRFRNNANPALSSKSVLWFDAFSSLNIGDTTTDVGSFGIISQASDMKAEHDIRPLSQRIFSLGSTTLRWLTAFTQRLSVLGGEAGALERIYTENTGRAVIQDGSFTHLNDVERTRFTETSPHNSVAAGVTINDTGFRVPAGKKLKIWYISGISDASGKTLIALADVFNGATIRSVDPFGFSTGDPSTNVADTTYQPAGAGAFNVDLQRVNQDAKAAHTFTGQWILSIE